MILHPVSHSQHDLLPKPKPIRGELLDWIIETFLDPTTHRKIIDLGCGGMALTRRYRNAGFNVTAVDIRKERTENKDLKGIQFVQQDVRETDLNGYEVISLLGLFYHMTLEDQVSLLNRIPKGTVTILETQIYEPKTVTKKGKPRLKATKAEGYWGALWREPGNDVKTASWNNETSFWHAPKSLYRLCRLTGFKAVMPVKPRFMSIYASRGYYILLK